MLYVATVNPHALYRYHGNESKVKMVDLYDVLPSASPMMQPRIKIAPMSETLEGKVIVYDEKLKVCQAYIQIYSNTEESYQTMKLF